MADEADSKSVVSDGVWVQVPPPAPKIDKDRKRLVDFIYSLLPIHYSPKICRFLEK